jgi:hypothetical protein
MYIRHVQTPSSSHSDSRSDCIVTLFIEISGYDVGDKGKHLLEDIYNISVARSSRMGL